MLQPTCITFGSDALRAPLSVRRREKPRRTEKLYLHELEGKTATCERAGVILYTVEEGEIYYGLGLDSEYLELTDFAGSVSRKDRDAVEAALREFREETLDIFGELPRERSLRATALWDGKNLVLLVRCLSSRSLVSALFRARCSLAKKPEVKEILWFSAGELSRLLQSDQELRCKQRGFSREERRDLELPSRDSRLPCGYGMYRRVRDFLKGNEDLTPLDISTPEVWA